MSHTNKSHKSIEDNPLFRSIEGTKKQRSSSPSSSSQKKQHLQQNPLAKALGLQKAVSSSRSSSNSIASKGIHKLNSAPRHKPKGLELLSSPSTYNKKITNHNKLHSKLNNGIGTGKPSKLKSKTPPTTNGNRPRKSKSPITQQQRQPQPQQQSNQLEFVPPSQRQNFNSSTIGSNDTSFSSTSTTTPARFQDQEPIHLLRIMNLAPQVTKHDVLNIMSKYGTILNVLIKTELIHTPNSATPMIPKRPRSQQLRQGLFSGPSDRATADPNDESLYTTTAELLYLEESSLYSAKDDLDGRRADGRILKLEIDTVSKFVRGANDWAKILDDVRLTRNAELAIQKAEMARAKAEQAKVRAAVVYDRF
ncbi:unnamed protein product [Ambrosiozyma monospora]|uniref:Unnamed protein product n=1 Tax=Ambrosiozyma monospora TaxID=43982 RepID=A0ACB5T323_AMBMO|nr:unnamed protein product [Ambrosiozyma monospora]